jgi:hypothetical protein
MSAQLGLRGWGAVISGGPEAGLAECLKGPGD